MPHTFITATCKSCGGKFLVPNNTGINTCGPCNAIFINALREFLGLDKIDKRIVPRKTRTEMV